MPFQNTVRFDTGFGVPGELRHDGPVRAEPGTIVSADPTMNVFGRVFTRLPGTTTWRAGNPDSLGVEFTILADPKLHASYGTAAAGPLAPTLTIPNNTVATMLKMGMVTVVSLTAADFGYDVRYVIATGEIKCVPTATTDATLLVFPTAKLERFPQPTAPGLVEIRITQ